MTGRLEKYGRVTANVIGWGLDHIKVLQDQELYSSQKEKQLDFWGDGK